MTRAANVAIALRARMSRAWWWLRQVSGDAAYENYLDSCSRRPAHECKRENRSGPLAPEDFYLEQLRRKYSSVNRCC